MRLNIEGVIGEISSFPACSQIAISHAVYVPPEERGQGKGYRACRERQRVVFGQLGYDVLLCTVDADNLPQVKIMEKEGFTCISEFMSRKTGHNVRLYCKKREEYVQGD